MYIYIQIYILFKHIVSICFQEIHTVWWPWSRKKKGLIRGMSIGDMCWDQWTQSQFIHYCHGHILNIGASPYWDSANHPLPKNKLRIPPRGRWLQSGFWFWPKHSLDTRGMLASVPLALDGFCCDSSTLRQTNVGNIGRQDVVDMTNIWTKQSMISKLDAKNHGTSRIDSLLMTII